MFTLRDILDATHGHVLKGGDARTIFEAASIDSRSIRHGEMFFAIHGTGQDGHGFVASALTAGGTGAVVSHKVEIAEPGTTIILVSDVTLALKQLSKFVRAKLNPTTIAITGSAGKTTTKDLTAHILGSRFSVRKSQSSYNNQYGLPLTILGVDESQSHLVVELGANHHGEIDELSALANPDVGVITNIGYAHIEHFGSLDGTLRAKTELLHNVRENGTIILNGDDPLLVSQLSKWRGGPRRVLTAGFSDTCDVNAIGMQVDESGISGKIQSSGETAPFRLNFVGRHFVSAAVLAVASSMASGMSLTNSAEALDSFVLPAGRLNLRRLNTKVVVLDDTYNGSPDAVLAALDTLADFSAKQRIAVIGEMRELGEFNQICHEKVGRAAAEVATHLVFVGESGKYAVSEAIGAGVNPDQAFVVESATEAFVKVKSIIDSSDATSAVLVKGSRFTHMERVVLGLSGTSVECHLGTCTKYIHCANCPLLEVACRASS